MSFLSRLVVLLAISKCWEKRRLAPSISKFCLALTEQEGSESLNHAYRQVTIDSVHRHLLVSTTKLMSPTDLFRVLVFGEYSHRLRNPKVLTNLKCVTGYM